ncbi:MULTISPECIES: 3-hydroxyacyl-CoA dehydrogenase family protein [unclassified Rhodococcus (in: high G+C Gram-positive bacteria)]|uniref:3-hydroxyacyl-CoA dehydrogenase family protein n=1 Tax=unclassified Rhodococcus (in: high G+C Gram-positive bacteria) TaxID=192944 RepID=UPI00163AFA53|nr:MULTISPECIES: 3-hydroxyacyl-CoA dehydrogenase family protein [unclassified Rhodococcus (in: high G+C Gram-positive bacteria)]MBC2639598.1 3-hydroxyacyl-CoA dehydrogenase family protein [Rhodococcus sp. 3A]MBC2895656.1 3-hydroxyacyl-CoA dehydrogenase family protein [Rhodococcus sp. 4CII]
MKVGVVGAGTMGAGVAECLAQAGHDVSVVDPDPRAVDGARSRMRDSLRLAILLGRTGGPKPAEVAARVRWTDSPTDLRDAAFVIECVPERIDLKEKVFAELDRVCEPEAILATCTSGIPVNRLAASVTRPERVVGLHFMNPAPLKDTVEVVRGPRTSAQTLDRALTLLASLDKTGIVVGDGPGFVLNRVLMLCIAEAAAALGDGIADAATTDALFEGCLGHPMGPLRTADLIGLDNVHDTMTALRELTGDDHYRPPESLEALIDAGHLGRKTGRGFHDYR